MRLPFISIGGGPARSETYNREQQRNQIERGLIWIIAAIAFGFLIIVFVAGDRPRDERGSFFGVAILGALAALGVGGAVGLLFGLPIRNDRASPSPLTVAGVSNPSGPVPEASPVQDDGWYKDNNSLERIAEWLTTAIVALTLVNFDGWIVRFDNAATSLTCALYDMPSGAQAAPPTVKDGTPMSGTRAPAQRGSAPASSTGAIGVAPKIPTQQLSLKASSPPAPSTLGPTATVAPSQCRYSNPMPGGLILATYALFGFLAAYLWSRRYLGGEFTRAIVEQQRARVTEARIVERARSANLVQSARKATTTAMQTAALTAAAPPPNAPMAQIPVVSPGPVPDDPWKGQFGGEPSNQQITLSANVSELVSRPGLYEVIIDVRPNDAAHATQLAGHPLRLYLHPTFPDPIRTLKFDASGQLSVPLIAYGAFTVGVQLDNGAVAELDLALLPNAPAQFKLA